MRIHNADPRLGLSSLVVVTAIASCAYDFDAAFDQSASEAGNTGGAAGADASAGGSAGSGGSSAQGGSDASASGSGGTAGSNSGGSGGGAATGGSSGAAGASSGGGAGAGGTSVGGGAGAGGVGTGGAAGAAGAGGVSGAGGFGGCATGFGNCDNDAKNGCESNLSFDEQNCGSCGKACGVLHTVSSSCLNGACVIACASGYADCDGVAGNGCEASLDSAQNCGACGAQCNSIHGMAMCQSGTCQLVCQSDWADCNGRGIDGCEMATGGMPEMCAMCAMYCDPSMPVCDFTQGCLATEPAGYSQYFPRCADLPQAVTTLPVVDLQPWSYSGFGVLENKGTGGPAFNMSPGSGTDAPQYVTGWPSFLRFDGTDYLRLASGANPALLDSLHRDGAVFTLLLELWIPDADSTQVIASTGSFANSPGMYVSANTSTLNLQVGDGSPSGAICPSGYALCLTGLTHGANADFGARLFAAFSINETSGAGIAWLNSASKSFPSSFATSSSAPASHAFEIGGHAENFPLHQGARLYRVRLWDVALDMIQLSALEQHSRAFCYW